LHSVSLNSECGGQLFYYVSDLHLEYQLLLAEKSLIDKQKIIDRKVSELVSSADDTSYPLLVAGDTADSFEISFMLFESLLQYWQGDIFAVLGNHELWNDNSNFDMPVDEVIAKYKAFAKKHPNLHILENELIDLKYCSVWSVLSEKQVLDMDPITFWKAYSSSSYIILGGIGFSGMNPVINAQTGAYRDKLTADEDAERSARFRRIHERLRLCAGAFRVIVLTHTPPQDWSSGRLCPNWIYVCGHNHKNSFDCPEEGPIILNDNQMGFIPRNWELKKCVFDSYHEYDPLDYLPEGINRIPEDEYINYLHSSGIGIQSFTRKGTIWAIKHDGVYLFLLEGKKLYILNGGRIYVAAHPLDYYDEYLTQYISQVRKAFVPYNRVMKRLGQEIRRLGGWGTNHGCIVDIDFWNHIYCDPRDGSISFYYATDMVNKLFYQDFIHLVRESPSLPCRESITKHLEADSIDLPVLLPPVNEAALLSVAPEIILDTSMYGPSRKMRSIQYALEKKVIRFWKDEILNYDFDSLKNKRIGNAE